MALAIACFTLSGASKRDVALIEPERILERDIMSRMRMMAETGTVSRKVPMDLRVQAVSSGRVKACCPLDAGA